MLGITQEAVIRHLNPVIGGWCRYYNSVVMRRSLNL
ncbi:group II intron maturase-specific domain-containing protein [Wolbachia endosymbiont of Tribolium confusum]|nr:hypothetical protein [Wolbachia endosymbiont of Tribolium confusum]